MLNTATLQGRLADDAELVTVASGRKLATFALLSSRAFNDSEEVVLVNCESWGRMAEPMSRLARGEEIWVQGALRPDRFKGGIKLSVDKWGWIARSHRKDEDHET